MKNEEWWVKNKGLVLNLTQSSQSSQSFYKVITSCTCGAETRRRRRHEDTEMAWIKTFRHVISFIPKCKTSRTKAWDKKNSEQRIIIHYSLFTIHFIFHLWKIKKGRRRPTLTQASPALPSAMESLTSVFGTRTGVSTPLKSPAIKPIAWCWRETQLQETFLTLKVKFWKNWAKPHGGLVSISSTYHYAYAFDLSRLWSTTRL